MSEPGYREEEDRWLYFSGRVLLRGLTYFKSMLQKGKGLTNAEGRKPAIPEKGDYPVGNFFSMRAFPKAAQNRFRDAEVEGSADPRWTSSLTAGWLSQKGRREEWGGS